MSVALRLRDNFKMPVTIARDLPYRSDGTADHERHRLDVYAPADAKALSVLLLIHGGVWKQGHKRIFTEPATTLAESGMVVVCPNYRLSPAVTHPAHVQDIAQAFDWTMQQIAKSGGDPKKIVVAGHSAGGHLAALLSTDDQFLKAHGRSLADLRGLIGISGVYRITTHESFQHAFGRDDAVCKEASPLHHVHDNTPPALLLHADKDIPMMDRQATDFATALREKKRTATVTLITDRDHHSIVSRMKNSDDPALKAIVEFVTTVTK